MATLVKQILDPNGISNPVFGAANSPDKVVPGPGVFLYFKNTNAATRDVTLDDPTSKDPGSAVQFNPDVTVTIAATTGELIIPVPDRFANPADGGLASWTLSATAGVTVAAFQI